MQTITRRLFLRKTAVATTIGTAIAVPTVAEAAEIHPLERLRALHDEASALMAHWNAHMGGSWELRVRAPDDRMPVLFMNLETETAEQKVYRLRRELIDANKAMYPEVKDWRVVHDDDYSDGEKGNTVGLFMVIGHRPKAVQS